MATPSAEGLFHRVIAESPANAGRLATPTTAMRFTEEFLSHLGVPLSDTEQLRGATAEQLRAAQIKVRGRPSDFFGFFPVLDANTVPLQPREVVAKGGGARVPLVIGTNRDEWNLFELPTPSDLEPIPNMVRDLVLRGFPAAPELIPAFVNAYRASREALSLPHHDRAIRRALLGDFRFRIPSIRFAEAHAESGLPTYAYLFTYPSPGLHGALGACHALELPFVFGTLDAPLQDRFAGSGEGVHALSTTMMHAWTAFAKSGSPAGNGAVENWPTFEPTVRNTRVFDVTNRIECAPLDAERRVWDGIDV